MWRITHDCLANAPRNVRSQNWDQDRAERATERFRLLDDDRNVYFRGVCTPNVDFEPLDEYGMPDSGCTIIEFREGGRWVAL